MGCNDIIAILQAVWHFAITILNKFLQLYVKVFYIGMLNYFYKTKKLHEIKLYSNDNKITKISFTIGVFLISTNKKPKMTSMKSIIFSSWGLYKWAIKRCIQLIERINSKQT